MAYEFANTLYRSHHNMLAGLAYEWWTGGGLNSPETIDDLGCSDDGLAEADEAITGWGLDRPVTDFDGGDGSSWMETNNTTREMIAEAILAFWRERPDRDEDE